jgi:hypothetical protein
MSLLSLTNKLNIAAHCHQNHIVIIGILEITDTIIIKRLAILTQIPHITTTQKMRTQKNTKSEFRAFSCLKLILSTNFHESSTNFSDSIGLGVYSFQNLKSVGL